MRRPTVRCGDCGHPWDDHWADDQDGGCDTPTGVGIYCPCRRTPGERIAALEAELQRVRSDCGHSVATRFRADNGDLWCFCGVLVERANAAGLQTAFPIGRAVSA